MRQYQRIQGLKSDSDSYEKLSALNLPSLNKKRFLDIGCNEGFFCGYAVIRGASAVQGIDADGEFIGRASAHFPEAKFRHINWDEFSPDEKLDVILLASALHYASDQVALIQKIMSWLDRDGVFVLEMGIAVGHEKKWIEVNRHDGRRLYPTRAMIEEVLAPFAFKLVGPSVHQDGDPVPRWVIHIKHKKPTVIFLASESYSGKSTLCRTMASLGAHIRAIDPALLEIFNLPASSLLGEFVQKNIINLNPIIDGHQIIEELFRGGVGKDFIAYLLRREIVPEITIIDGYIPKKYIDKVVKYLEELEYFVWEASRPASVTVNMFEDPKNGMLSVGGRVFFENSGRTRGSIDSVSRDGASLKVSGWAADKFGRPIREICVGVGMVGIMVPSISAVYRQDLVDAGYCIENESAGFDFTVDLKNLNISEKKFESLEDVIDFFAIGNGFEFSKLRR